MRDAGRIDKVLTKIRKIWKQYPDLRFMQLLGNVLPAGLDPYYVEDDELLKKLDIEYPRGETDITLGFGPSIASSNLAGGATPVDIDVLHDLLLLVSYDVPKDIIKQWVPEKRALVEEWAALTHLEASDNCVRIVTVPNRPDCLDGYEDDDQHPDWMNETPP